MSREEAISKQIQELSGDKFEDFAYGLLSRELYPGLTPTSRSGDEGEDAHTEWSTLILHEGKWISVSASKDGSWTKLEADCQTCKQKGHTIDILVFAIAGNPQRDPTISRWKTDVKDKYGWELEVKPLNWFKSIASKPVHESFVDDHLGIPPPDGDFIQTIRSEFANRTHEATAQIHSLIPGLDEPLPRPEIEQIENYLQQGVPVTLVGDPGTGKSGIAKKLAVSAQRQQKVVLLLDARRVTHVHSETELRREIPLRGPVRNAIERVGKHQGCRFIIDQFDNTIGYTSERILTELAEDCCHLEGVEIVTIARPRGGAEKLLETLKKMGFVSVISELLDEPLVVEVLNNQLKIPHPAQELVTLGKSLLNLSLIGRIKEQQSTFDFSNPLDEIDLWEKFIEVLEEHEQIGSEPRKAQELIEGAKEFARIGLNNPNRTFTLPHAHRYQRLISWQIITPVEVKSRVFRFSHEQLQDFFYAWNAANEQLPPKTVINDIDPHKSRNVLVWMDKIYTQRNSSILSAFFSELFHPSSRIPFYSQASVLDRYISSSNPQDNPIALTAILNLLHNQPELRSYFFRSKPDPAWVAILWDHDFFETPPPYEPETIRWGPRWDVQFHLLSVADQVPDFVVKHFKSISVKTWHSWYISQAIEALCYIPPDKVLPLVPQIINWLEDPQLTFTIAPSVFRLTKKLAQNKKMAAFDLFSTLTEPIPTPDTETGLPIISKFEGRTLEREILFQVLGLLGALNIQKLVATLEEQLCVTLRLEASLMRRPNFEFSGRWRKTVADDEFEQREGIYSKYTEWDYKNRLLRMLRDALQGWVEQDAGAVRILLERYLVDPHQILRRVALYLLCQFPTRFPSLVTGELGWQDDVFTDPPPYERLLLLKEGYPLLNSEAQESLVATICTGPPPQYLDDARKHFEQRNLEQVDEYVQYEADKWKLDKLWMLRDYLTGEPKDLLDRLVNAKGVPRYAVSSSTELTPVEYESPLTEEEIVQMSPDELLDFLKQWDPTPKIAGLIRIWHKVLRKWSRFLRLFGRRISQFDNPAGGSGELPGRNTQDSYEVFAGSIARVVVANPHKYRSRLVAIASHHPQIAYALLNHYININNSPSIPWSICLDLCEGLLKDRYIQRDMTPAFGGGWVNVRRSIVRLLEVGLGETERAIPFEDLYRSKDILCLLVDDPDPQPKSDNPPPNYVGHNDPIHVAINHVRPMALSALVDFAYRNAILARQLQTPSEDDVKGHGPNRLGRDVQVTLTRKLDRRADPSWAVHSVYGRRLITLHWLNFEWTKAHIDQIFPDDNDVRSIKYFMAAWDSFVVSHHHYGCKEMLELLRPKYMRAINNLSQGHTTQIHLNPAQGLARHVAWEYLMSDYDLRSPAFHEGLIFFFYQNAPMDAASNLAWFFWRVCAENKEQRDRYWSKVRDLWGWRNETAITANNVSDFDQEMKHFANLPRHAPASESIVTLRPLLDGLLPHITRTPEGNLGQDAIEEYLLQEVSRYPVETIDYYQQIRDSVASPHWFAYSHGEKLHKILETAAADPSSRQNALNLIQSFPRIGIHKYDDIYYKYAG